MKRLRKVSNKGINQKPSEKHCKKKWRYGGDVRVGFSRPEEKRDKSDLIEN